MSPSWRTRGIGRRVGEDCYETADPTIEATNGRMFGDRRKRTSIVFRNICIAPLALARVHIVHRAPFLDAGNLHAEQTSRPCPRPDDRIRVPRDPAAPIPATNPADQTSLTSLARPLDFFGTPAALVQLFRKRSAYKNGGLTTRIRARLAARRSNRNKVMPPGRSNTAVTSRRRRNRAE